MRKASNIKVSKTIAMKSSKQQEAATNTIMALDLQLNVYPDIRICDYLKAALHRTCPSKLVDSSYALSRVK